ncbi:hypothetical protein AM1_F0103 (plasmid) [Acaryochloris marina MBIC11017]|uniref:Uncharacterized protein n=1 Tax=Acaryochloris marina (strain MBIC 11017) TaxID=329726 RepID=A8ZQ84_ACAM1|nr:hypothetical protein AM1_F0103 [Acaryochloris marina MBIC11017]
MFDFVSSSNPLQTVKGRNIQWFNEVVVGCRTPLSILQWSS